MAKPNGYDVHDVEEELKPNYEVMFKQFLTTLQMQGEAIVEDPPNAYIDYRSFHNFLWALTMALQCATNVPAIEQVREVLTKLVGRSADTLADLPK